MDTATWTARILIVDDSREELDLMAEMIAGAGYRTEGAASGPEALGRARRNPPDLILLDVAMPEMDGVEVCRHLRADARTGDVPVLFVTGLGGASDKEAGLLAGADDYVTKPVDPVDLLARVRALLRVRHLSLELDRTLAYLQELEAARRTPATAAADRTVAGEGLAPRQAVGDVGPAREAAARPEGPAAHVLLVDDDRLVRRLYGHVMESARYRVTGVGTAAEAYKAAAGGVDAIVLDIMMPGVSGLEALDRLRQLAPDVPIIMLTAYQTTQNAVAALRGGAFDFVVKGTKHEVLLNSVARAVERRRLMLENRRLMEELRARLDEALAPPRTPAS